ncbi:MAG: serine/threonine protein phosphatase [Rhodobacteraceae bacterium]|nr:serine/threonine protein phosphatase [Paracoccaceae bacterium]
MSEPFVAVGDIHGRADLLESIAERIGRAYPGRRTVFLGDYIDRGEYSAEVLRLLMGTDPEGPYPVTCLKGNHEEMCLRFIDNPADSGRHWLRNGGLQTLASFGIGGIFENAEAEQLEKVRDSLAEAMGDDMLEWLRALPTKWNSGNVWAVHAGADPDLPMTFQSEATLLWGHPEFLRARRPDGQWIVHGHTIFREPVAGDGRVSIDLGAYATGRLQAAAFDESGVTFLST